MFYLEKMSKYAQTAVSKCCEISVFSSEEGTHVPLYSGLVKILFAPVLFAQSVALSVLCLKCCAKLGFLATGDVGKFWSQRVNMIDTI